MRDELGALVVPHSIHRVIHLHIEHCWAYGYHAAVQAPFGHGKSVQVAVGRVAFELGRNINLRVKIVCNNDDKAKGRAMGVSQLLLSPRFRSVFPDVRPVSREKAKRTGQNVKWTQHQIFLDRPGQSIDPSVEAAGILSGGTGGRSDLTIFDDICDRRNSVAEPKTRNEIIKTFDEVWMSRLESDGRAAYLATPWHDADNTAMILHNSRWSTIRIFVAPDLSCLEMEVYNPPPNYPIPIAA